MSVGTNYFTKNLITSFVVMSAVCVVMLLVIIIMNGFVSMEMVWKSILYNFYYGIPLSLLNGLFFDKLSEHIPWEEHPKKRTWLGVIGSIILTMSTLFTLNLILWVGIWGGEIADLFSERNRNFYVIAFVITIIITSIIHAISFFKRIQEEKLINEQLRKEKLEMQLAALKSNLDPHFLFNSFNTLSGLIDEDTGKAQKHLAELSAIYRFILENRNEDTNTIQSELEFSKKYLGLQQTRFEDSIELEVKVDEQLMEKSLPSLSLQLLLENAIKHNAFDEEQPLKIKVYSENNHLMVSNNKRKRKNLAEGSGMGLQNIKDRYRLLIQQEPQIEDLKDLFTVKLPIIS